MQEPPAQPTEALYAKSMTELQGLSDDELVRQHDEIRKVGIVDVRYYLDELARRRSDRQATRSEEQALRVEQQTQTMVHLTKIITGLTVLNVVLVAVTIFK